MSRITPSNSPLPYTAVTSLITLLILAAILTGACKPGRNNDAGDTAKLETDDLENKITDIDGNTYAIVKIGAQVWMKEDLKVTRYQNGDAIPRVADPGEWSSSASGAYCEPFNDTVRGNVYGRLYNWYAVNDERNVCPAGWRVPLSSDYAELDHFLGGASVAGAKLKEEGTSHWNDPNMGATNESGFTALPGGHRNSEGTFERLGTHAYFWNKNEYDSLGGCAEDSMCAHECSVNFENSYFLQDWGYKNRGMSVRCLKEDKEKQ